MVELVLGEAGPSIQDLEWEKVWLVKYTVISMGLPPDLSLVAFVAARIVSRIFLHRTVEINYLTEQV